jgi:hypothetical protein
MNFLSNCFQKNFLTTMDNCFSFQPLILQIILSTKCMNQSLLSAPTKAGRPRYLFERASISI